VLPDTETAVETLSPDHGSFQQSSERPPIAELAEPDAAIDSLRGMNGWLLGAILLTVFGLAVLALSSGRDTGTTRLGHPLSAGEAPDSASTDTEQPTTPGSKAAVSAEKNAALAPTTGTSASSKTSAQLPSLALRTPKPGDTCDDLLGRPFTPKASPKPATAQALWRQALNAMMRGKVQVAQKQMCLSAEWNQSGPATYGLAEFLMKRADYAQALTWAARVRNDAQDASRRARELTGDIYAQEGKLDDARQAWLGLFAEAPGDAPIASEIAARYVKAAKQALSGKDDGLTERIFRRAVILDPTNADSAAGLAIALRRQKLTVPAREWVSYAVSSNPQSALAQIELLEQQYRANEIEQARATLLTAQELAPKNQRVAFLARALK
jgi:tetratricopeptide (TPR) repeat protein